VASPHPQLSLANSVSDGTGNSGVSQAVRKAVKMSAALPGMV
jgi:hypothetical protein